MFWGHCDRVGGRVRGKIEEVGGRDGEEGGGEISNRTSEIFLNNINSKN